MSETLRNATPDDLERYAEEMAQWAESLGVKGDAFGCAAAILRAVAKAERDAVKKAHKTYQMEPSWFVNPVGELQYALADEASKPDSLVAALASLLTEEPPRDA